MLKNNKVLITNDISKNNIFFSKPYFGMGSRA